MGEMAESYTISFRYDLSEPENRPDWRVRLHQVRFDTVEADNCHRIESVVLKLSCDHVGGLPEQFWLTGCESREGKEKVNSAQKGVITDFRITAKEPRVSVGIAKRFTVPNHRESSMNSLIAVLINRIDCHKNIIGVLQLHEVVGSLVKGEGEVLRVFQSMPNPRRYHVVIQRDLLPGKELLGRSIHIWKASIHTLRLRDYYVLEHRFLALEVQFSERNSNPAGKWLSSDRFWITGELNREEEEGVINVFISPNKPKFLGTGFSMLMDDRLNPSAVPMSWVTNILISHPSRYDFSKHNCYEYAYAICRKLGKDFAERCSSKEATDRVLKDLKTLRRPKHLKEVLKKKGVVGGIVGTAVAFGVLCKVATICPPLTIAAVFIAPQATLVTAGLLLVTPALSVGISSGVKVCKVVVDAWARKKEPKHSASSSTSTDFDPLDLKMDLCCR